MKDFSLRALRSKLEKQYLEHRGYASGREFISKILASVGAGDILLDIGCGEGNLRKELPSEVQFVGLDRYVGEQSNEYVNWNMRPTVVGDFHNLPFAPESFRAVVLMQVLEHSSYPTKLFAEIARVLQPGGSLFVTVPFLHEVHHAPHDYFRFTPFGLTSLAEAAELRVLEIRPSGGYFRALSHMLEEAPTVVCGSNIESILVRVTVSYPLKGLGWLIRKLQYLLDLQDDTQTFTCGYDCKFKKSID